MAGAYATLAAQGRRADPYLVQSVTSTDDRFTEYTASPAPTQAVTPQVAADTLEAMRRVVTGGTAQRAQGHRPAAG